MLFDLKDDVQLELSKIGVSVRLKFDFWTGKWSNTAKNVFVEDLQTEKTLIWQIYHL